MHVRLSRLLLTGTLAMAACDPEPNEVLVTLAPEVISSIDGTTAVRATVLADRDPVPEEDVTLSVEYTDRNGGAHAIASAEGTTDDRGAFEVVIAGLTWDGTGAVTVALAGDDTVVGIATFAVLDRTAPTATIAPPTDDLHVRQGQEVTVEIQVADEIGVSEVFFEAAGSVDRQRSTVVASGAAEATVEFGLDVGDNAALGQTITLYALVKDLSGNLGAAAPITLTVDPMP